MPSRAARKRFSSSTSGGSSVRRVAVARSRPRAAPGDCTSAASAARVVDARLRVHDRAPRPCRSAAAGARPTTGTSARGRRRSASAGRPPRRSRRSRRRRAGCPTRGKAWKSGVRAEARPVSRPCQNGELADSASSSGRCARSRLTQRGSRPRGRARRRGRAARTSARGAPARASTRRAPGSARPPTPRCRARRRTGACPRRRRAGPERLERVDRARRRSSRSSVGRAPHVGVRRRWRARAPTPWVSARDVLDAARVRATASTVLRSACASDQPCGLEQHHLLLDADRVRRARAAAFHSAQARAVGSSCALTPSRRTSRRRAWSRAAATNARNSARCSGRVDQRLGVPLHAHDVARGPAPRSPRSRRRAPRPRRAGPRPSRSTAWWWNEFTSRLGHAQRPRASSEPASIAHGVASGASPSRAGGARSSRR